MHDRYFDLGEGVVIRVRTPHEVKDLDVSERQVSISGDDEVFHPIEEVVYGDFSEGGFGVK